MSLALDLFSMIGQPIEMTSQPGSQGNSQGPLDTGFYTYIATATYIQQANMFSPLNVIVGTFIDNLTYSNQANLWSAADLNPTLLPSNVHAGIYDSLAQLKFKVRGFYTAGGHYETFIVNGQPTNYNPNTRHYLDHIIVEVIW
jgi:hypothetical protein